MSQPGASEQPHQDEDHKRTENKRLTKASGPSVADEVQKIGVPDLKMQKNAPFLAERMKIFAELIEKQNQKYKGKQIVIVLMSLSLLMAVTHDVEENARKFYALFIFSLKIFLQQI